jgi:hypothetical protein
MYFERPRTLGAVKVVLNWDRLGQERHLRRHPQELGRCQRKELREGAVGGLPILTLERLSQSIEKRELPPDQPGARLGHPVPGHPVHLGEGPNPP